MADTSGNPLADGVRTTRLLERAVRERWPIPDQYRKAIIDRQVKIAIDPASTAREAAAAAKTVLAADRINQQDEQGPAQEQHLHLYQPVPVELSNATDAELEEIERKLLAIAARNASGGEGGEGTPSAEGEPVRVREGGVAHD